MDESTAESPRPADFARFELAYEHFRNNYPRPHHRHFKYYRIEYALDVDTA